jgi:membrane-bound lytic murein transglycosylase F
MNNDTDISKETVTAAKSFIRRKRKPLIILLVVTIAAVVLFTLIANRGGKGGDVICHDPINRDLQHILSDGKIKAVIDFSSTNYFVFKGIPMGFQYDMLSDLAKKLELQLDVTVETDVERMKEMLLKGQVDIIAMDMAITRDRKANLAFTQPHLITRQMLVQRLPENYASMNSREIEKNLVRSVLDLDGKVVYVPFNSSYVQRLENIMHETGITIYIKSSRDVSSERLIEMVSKGDISYTVCDEHVAGVEQEYYRNIDCHTPLSFEQEVAWAVRKSSDGLLDAINLWQRHFISSPKYSFLVKKYFNSQRSISMMRSEFNSIKGGKISEYDDLIRLHAKSIGWDWRLLASLIYQESNFKHDLTSWAGAYGLMQLMPVISIKFGADSFAQPNENILAGVRFIRYIESNFKAIPDHQERIKFVLASYNVGMGHIIDARKLARKHGKNPDIWEGNAAHFLELKSQAPWYLDPVVKSGFCRGKDVVDFVNDVLQRYEHYKNVVPE